MRKRIFRIITVLLCLIAAISFAGCLGSGDDRTAESTGSTSADSTTFEDGNGGADNIAAGDNINNSESETVTEKIPKPSSGKATTESEISSDPTKASHIDETGYSRSGVMAISFSPKNKYLAAVAEKYEVEAENLVSIYTVPDADDNMVLQFDGSKNSDGKLIRTEDTLVAVYTIDINLSSKCASKDKAKNEYSYGEMMVIFLSTNRFIIPEFESELNS